ncbi:6-bladed beta-propeller [Parabacteroides sp. OttesenSCG-928-G06]|nr:6-bladed beta-propeller [Parabacteroides sp. OttesenSCG-928-G06]
MKKATGILVFTLLLMVGCKGEQQSAEDFFTVDVTKEYSQKEELVLQDFMDVEYVALETNEEFVNQGFVQDVGKEFIVVKNRAADGDIFIYDRTGKAIRKINRRGQGGEEYNSCFKILLDEENKELFVSDISLRKILAYDMYGNFKRSFKHREEGGSLFYTEIFNYDKDHLICYDPYNETVPFVLISKQDGSIVKDIIPAFKEKKMLQQRSEDGENTYTVSPGPHRTIMPFKGNWMLLEHSSDTVYTFLPDYNLQPLLARTPSIQSMDPEVYLTLRLFSDRYIFMEAVKNVYNWTTKKGFPTTYIAYDRQEKRFLGYTIYNGDYTTKKDIYMSRLRPVNHEIDSWSTFEAYQLVESYGKGELQGKLKEIAATLDEEDNVVVMLVKHKK